MKIRERSGCFLVVSLLVTVMMAAQVMAFSFSRTSFTSLKPENGVVSIPVNEVNDGKAHYFNVTADDGVLVSFFALKSSDGIMRTAIDSCDVCYRSGKGYVQDGDFMVCTNCGIKFASNRINEVKGGCNPAPLNRIIDKDRLIIQMADINANAWYCKFKN
ncbi:MAG: DUF2318 domain-containing protein [Pseudomonadota bacterium]